MALLGILSSTDSTTATTTAASSATASQQQQLGKKKSSSFCGDEVASRRVTDCDWSANARNPRSIRVSRRDDFDEFREVVRLAREEGCLFARKFSGVASITTSSISSSSSSNKISNNRSSKTIVTCVDSEKNQNA